MASYNQQQKKIWDHQTPWQLLRNKSSKTPEGRHWHTGNICKGVDNTLHYIIFGGYSTNAQTGHSDVWSMALDTNTWSMIKHKNISSVRSTARYSHTAVILHDTLSPDPPGTCNLYIFGGTIRSETTLKQTDEKKLYHVKFIDSRTNPWPKDLPNWTMYIQEIKNYAPFTSERASHSAVKLNHRMYIFGGVSGFANGVAVHNDFWSYSIRTKQWRDEHGKPIQGLVPTGRFNHRAVLYRASSSSRDMYKNTVHMIIFGGQGLNSYTFSMHDDLWSVMLIGNDGKEVETIKWKQLLQAKGSIKRTDGVMIIWNSYIVYFGGMELTSSASFVYRDIFRTDVQNLIEADLDAKFERSPKECKQYPRKNYKVKCIGK